MSERVECPKCGTRNPVGSKFCESCGYVLTQKTASAEPPRRRRRAPAKDESREIQKQLTRARDTLKNLRLIYAIFGVVALLPTALIVMATLKTGSNVGVFPAIMWVLATAFLLSGVFFLYAQPLFFTVTAACLATLLTVLAPELIWALAIGLVAVGCWGTVPLILKIMRLKQDYPDLITSEKLKRRESRDVDTAEARVRATERRSRERKAAMRSYAIVGGVILVAIIGLITWRSWPDGKNQAFAIGNSEPQLTDAQKKNIKKAFHPALEKFIEIWKRSDGDALAAMGSEEFLNGRWRRTQAILRKRGWEESYPEILLDTVFEDRQPTKNEVWFDVTPKGTLKTKWVYENNAWLIRILVFSRTK